MTRTMPADPDTNISGYWPEEWAGTCSDCAHLAFISGVRLCCWEHDTGEGAYLHPAPEENTCPEWEVRK